MSKIKIVIAGCGGRMGKVLLDCVAQADDLVLHAALEHEGNAMIGTDAGGGIKITSDIEAWLPNVPTKANDPLIGSV